MALIVIDDPEGTFYGGQIAAPVFKNIMSQLVRYYQISPTVADKEDGKTKPARVLPSVSKNDSGDVMIPDFNGWSLGQVKNWLGQAGLSFVPEGDGYAVSQNVSSGSFVPTGTAIQVEFAQ